MMLEVFLLQAKIMKTKQTQTWLMCHSICSNRVIKRRLQNHTEKRHEIRSFAFDSNRIFNSISSIFFCSRSEFVFGSHFLPLSFEQVNHERNVKKRDDTVLFAPFLAVALFLSSSPSINRNVLCTVHTLKKIKRLPSHTEHSFLGCLVSAGCAFSFIAKQTKSKENYLFCFCSTLDKCVFSRFALFFNNKMHKINICASTNNFLSDDDDVVNEMNNCRFRLLPLLCTSPFIRFKFFIIFYCFLSFFCRF